ncbi:hypothetical protein CK203_028830 [Vitis vinifera]|uniref:Uncharacterized protein n=1 Tax=Vitis vinifera TaxID=29760 RepID=A0A438IAL0_VITVI|nr:hypothetical protein CK203_028830 [Vitis vinifera]
MALPPPRGIMTSQKVFPPLKREAELLTLYKRAFTQGGSYVDHWDARHQHWRRLWENSDSVDGKDVHTFQKPLVGQGRRRLFRMALSHREKTAGKRATNAGSPPGDSETKRRKRCVAYPGFIDGASSWLALKRSGSKLKA